MKGDDLVAPGVDVGCCRHRLERRSEPADDAFDLNGDHLGDEGLLAKRAEQQLDFTWAMVRDELDQRLRLSPGVRGVRDEVRAAVLAGELPATVAADRLLAAYDADPR